MHMPNYVTCAMMLEFSFLLYSYSEKHNIYDIDDITS